MTGRRNGEEEQEGGARMRTEEGGQRKEDRGRRNREEEQEGGTGRRSKDEDRGRTG